VARGVPLLQPADHPLDPFVIQHVQGGSAGGVLDEVGDLPRGQLMGGTPPLLAARRLFVVLDDEAVSGQLAQVVGRRTAGLAEPPTKFRRRRRPVDAQGAQHAGSQRMGQRAQRRQVLDTLAGEGRHAPSVDHKESFAKVSLWLACPKRPAAESLS
jgi:hypothetical protein